MFCTTKHFCITMQTNIRTTHDASEPFPAPFPRKTKDAACSEKENLLDHQDTSQTLPDFVVKVRRYVLTYFLTSSSLDRLNSLRILDALLGPLILGFSMSVKPGKSFSPFFTITKFRTERSGLTMHPRTDFLLRSPLRLP